MTNQDTSTHSEPAATGSSAAAGTSATVPSLFISVIVSVRNEAKFIERTLTQLVAQRYPADKREIIVLDGQSTDNTAELVEGFARQHPNVRLYPNPKRLSSAARNIGIRHAQGDVVLVVDGHCEIPDDRMLANLADAFQTSGADCIGRPQPLKVTGATPLQRAIATARSSRLGHHPDSYIYSSEAQFVPAASVAVAYRREVFEKVGYFDEIFDACEDYEFNVRCDKAGLRCYFTPKAAVRYFPRNSLAGLFRQLVRYGRGRVRMLRKHRETFSAKTLLPAVFVAGCAIGWGGAWLWAPLAAMYLGVLASYLGIVLFESVRLAARSGDLWLLPWLPFVFATVHFAAGTGLLAEVVFPQR
jgi:succinoglycan biosynthesis protein ExoA